MLTEQQRLTCPRALPDTSEGLRHLSFSVHSQRIKSRTEFQGDFVLSLPKSAVRALVLHLAKNPKMALGLLSHERVFVIFRISIFAPMCRKLVWSCGMV